MQSPTIAQTCLPPTPSPRRWWYAAAGEDGARVWRLVDETQAPELARRGVTCTFASVDELRAAGERVVVTPTPAAIEAEATHGPE